MTFDEFAAAVDIDPRLAEPAFAVFQEELSVPRKTRAARCADLAEGLRNLGVAEDCVYLAAGELARLVRR